MLARLGEEAAARRAEPRDDLLTALVPWRSRAAASRDGELQSVLWNLIGGGLDTTTSLTALSLHHLDAPPATSAARLVAEPGLLGPATEEFLRYFSVNETLTRTVTRDAELAASPSAAATT